MSLNPLIHCITICA